MPYLPEGRSVSYVDVNHPHMAAAKKMSLQSNGCRWKNGSVIVLNNNVIAQGANCIEVANRPMYCAREVLECKSGEGYDHCPTCVGSHAERSALQNAQECGVVVAGADLYLYGHWWCCKPCWDEMIQAGIKDVYLLSEAQEHFEVMDWVKPTWSQDLKTYISCPLTHSPEETRQVYKKIQLALDLANLNCHAPHTWADPIIKGVVDVTAEQVYKNDYNHVVTAQLVIAVLNEPSLGVGIELQIAQQYGIPIIGVVHEDVTVSRMALGIPQMLRIIKYKDLPDMLKQLNNVLHEVVVPRYGI